MKDFLDLYRRFLREKVRRLVPMNSFYVPYSSEETKPYDQLARVRNAFAHMNYGHFEFLLHREYGTEYLIGYSIYNKDKETNESKFHGFILEPVLHYFIQSYFSNYTSYGIVYKHTWFSWSSMSEYQYSSVINEYTDVKVNSLIYKKDEKYTGNFSHEMISFTKIFKNLNHEEIMAYITSHSAEFEHSVYNISKEEFDEKLKFVQNELGREVTIEEFCSSIKFLYDFETEFSNFLVHLMQLNDRIIDYISPWIENSSKNKDKILSSIEELKEDKYSWLAFKYMFPILSVINICLRFEDDDLFKINPKNVDIEGFVIDNTNLERFMETHSNIKEENKTNVYILERLRNSVAHGHIHLTLKDGSMSYQFTDAYNNRSEQISISYFALNQFINQSVFKQRD
ncbi:hypothetical protein [Streptococcus handemini]|uniref:hypothetical protein n=2 Tax=Streptococcus handemini TaxID=3161188 RepID=UPI0032EC9954